MKRVLLTALIFAASAANAEIYRWVDSQGTTHYTNSMDEIPVRYRARAKPLAYETGNKADAATPLLGGEGQALNDGKQTAPLAGGVQNKQIAPVPAAENEVLLQRGRRLREYRKSDERQVAPRED